MKVSIYPAWRMRWAQIGALSFLVVCVSAVSVWAQPQAPASPPSSPAQPVPTSKMTAEVLRLMDSGADTSVIKSYIDSAPAAQPLSADDIIVLHQRGVPSDLISEMVRRGAAAPAAPWPGQNVGQSAPTEAQASLPPAVSTNAPVTTVAPVQPAPVYQPYVYPYPAYSVYPYSYYYGGPSIYFGYGGYWGPRWYGPQYYGHYGGGLHYYGGGRVGGFHGGLGYHRR